MQSNNTSKEISRIIASSSNNRVIRVGILTTRDREHALNIIRDTAVTEKKDLYHYTVASRRKWNQKQFKYEAAGGSSQDPAELLRSAQNIRGGAVVVIEDLLNTLCDRNGDKNARTQLCAMLSPEKPNDGTVIVFLEPPESQSNIPSILESAFFKLSIPMPNRQEIQDIAFREVTAVLTETGQPNAMLAQEWTRDLTPELTGLTRTAACFGIRDSLALNKTDFKGAKRYLAERKKIHLTTELAMDILDSRFSELPIGMDNVYGYLEINKERICETGKDRAKGILLLGPPGTGKTMFAKAAGAILNLPVVEFRISALMNSLLGETERRFDQAFQTLEAMAPNVVFIDEFEKAFGQSGTENDGGTMKRTTGRLLSWLSDNPQPNFIIATSNNISRMGELGDAMLRSGRFDKLFFVDVPNREARKQILNSLLKGKMEDIEADVTKVAEETAKFTGADLRAVVNEALMLARYMKTPLTLELLLKAIKKKTLKIQAIYDRFNELRQFAEYDCEPAGPQSEI